jgi:hypothetical protein
LGFSRAGDFSLHRRQPFHHFNGLKPSGKVNSTDYPKKRSNARATMTGARSAAEYNADQA